MDLKLGEGGKCSGHYLQSLLSARTVFASPIQLLVLKRLSSVTSTTYLFLGDQV